MSTGKSELQKMIHGELYQANDRELTTLRTEARRLTRQLNQSTEEELAKRSELLGQLFGKVGERAFIEPPFHCDYGFNITVGKDFFMNFGGVILDCAPIRIGDNVLCGPNVQIYSATHPLDAELRSTGAESAKPITIGHRVWLGGAVVVCPGVTIGDNTTIGAGSVVTKDIPANVFAAGNPCKVLRELK